MEIKPPERHFRISADTVIPALEPPDYSAESLIDISVGPDYLEMEPITWDLIEAQEPVHRGDGGGGDG